MSGPVTPREIDPVIHERARLSIVSALAVVPDFPGGPEAVARGLVPELAGNLAGEGLTHGVVLVQRVLGFHPGVVAHDRQARTKIQIATQLDAAEDELVDVRVLVGRQAVDVVVQLLDADAVENSVVEAEGLAILLST